MFQLVKAGTDLQHECKWSGGAKKGSVFGAQESSPRRSLRPCRGTWDPLVPCPFYHNLPRLSPQNLHRIHATLKEKRSAVFDSRT